MSAKLWLAHKLLESMNNQQIQLDKVTRVEVIDQKGRAYTNYHCKEVILSPQDASRTLKVFVTNADQNTL